MISAGRFAPGLNPGSERPPIWTAVALGAYGWGAGGKSPREAGRDDNNVGRREKGNAGAIEGNRRTRGGAWGRQASIGMPETTGCKIVMVIFGRLSR